MGGYTYENIFHNHFNLIASHTNSHTNTSTGLIANSNNNNAILGLMNNIIIINNSIIIRFSLILQQQQESNPRLPLDYTANYDYLILLFLTISSRYLIRYYLSIEQQGIEPYTTSVHHITLTAVLYSCAKVLRNSLALLLWTIHHSSGQLDSNQHHMFPKHVCYH